MRGSMPVLDFKEIPSAAAGAARDQFELFAREFLDLVGFRIIEGPDRGADAGRDLVVEEIRTGVAGETRLKWLVSCKHKAHSGNAVTPEDERDIHDRVRTHGCRGFLGFYSTVPSSGLATKLNASDLNFEVQVFDQERIEKSLLTTDGLPLARRFFPLSIERWQREHPSPAKIFSQDPELSCFYCKKTLLHPKPHGIVVIWHTIREKDKPRRIEHVYWCCKGQCDRALRSRFMQRGLIDGWEDIPDLIAPIAYIRLIMATINQLHDRATYSEEALKNEKAFLLNLFPLISRDMTTDERKRIAELAVIPNYLGGWGYED
jgi:hypothetical protein